MASRIDPSTAAVMLSDLVSGCRDRAHLDPMLAVDPDQVITTITDVLLFAIATLALVAATPPRRLEAVTA